MRKILPRKQAFCTSTIVSTIKLVVTFVASTSFQIFFFQVNVK